MSMSVTNSQDYLVQDGCSLTCCREKRIGIQRRTLIIICSITAFTIVGLVVAVIVLAVRMSSSEPETSCSTPECNLHAAQLLYRLDENINPCNDFYKYACGKGLDDFVVNPPAFIQNDFSTQQAKINSRIHELLVDEYEAGYVMEKPVKLYKSCLSQNDTKSTDYLRKLLKSFGEWPLALGASWNDKNIMSKLENVFPYLFQFSKYRQFGVLFTAGVTPDMYNTSRNLAVLIQPSKKNLYQIIGREKMIKTIQDAFMGIVQYFNISASKESVFEDIKNLLDVNDIIYKALPEIEPRKTDYQVIKIETLMKETGNKIQWLDYLKGIFENIKSTEFKSTDYVGVQGMQYFKRISAELTQKFNQTVGRAIVNFEIVQLLLSAAEYTKHKEYILQSNDPNEEPSTRPPWASMCIKWVSDWFGYSIAHEYAKRFMDASKTIEMSKELTNYITQAYEERLSTLSWLDADGHNAALDKIHQLSKYYIFPEWVKDEEKITEFYNEFNLTDDNVENSIAYKVFDNLRNYRRINGDGINSFKRWPKTPLEVNAFYIPSDNSINILQAILQSPVFGEDRLRVMNFGSLGSIIGHEITHGFDMTGRQYDGKGNLVEWMSPNVVQEFTKKAECFVKQYEKYFLTSDDIPGLKNNLNISGARTISENIADGGGIRNAYWAYKKWEKDHGTEVVPRFLKRFTNDQVFFISYAHTWCTKYADYSKALEQSINHDVHSPSRIRILGALSNFKEFSEVFHCTAGETMNPSDRCILW